jgi:glutathione S-transferase
VATALELKELDYERVDLEPGEAQHEQMARIYGDGKIRVPGLSIGEERVHGSRPILARLEELEPDPPLFPESIADAVRDAEAWGETEIQNVTRRLWFGALYFRPEAMGTYLGVGPLDPAGTDSVIEALPWWWEYNGVSAERLAADLAGLPPALDHVDELAGEGVIDGDQPTAADLQVGAPLSALLTVGDLRPLIEGRAGERIARRWFPDNPGAVPAGAFPAGWVPAA